MQKQKTLAASFSLKGKGLHTGLDIEITFNPAPENHGYKIKRVDMEGQPTIDALAENVVNTQRGTVLSKNGVQVSTIVSKGISAGHSQNSYRGLVKVSARAEGARNHSQCDSLLLSSTCGAHTFPYADIQNETAIVEHEATTSKISEEQLFYCQQRGISVEEAVGLIVNGYAREVMNKLPMEFAVEAQKLLTISLEGSVG